MHTKQSRSTLVAASVLLALGALAGAAHAADAPSKEALGRCYGINTCKGESLCATAKNDCKGLNSCKGEGVVVKTQKDCLAAGGSVTEPKK